MFHCFDCMARSTRKDNFTRHVKNIHGNDEGDFIKKEHPQFDYALKAPFALIVSGMPQSGKSTIASLLLARRNEMIDPAPKSVLRCYTEAQPRLFSTLKKREVPGIEFHEGLPEDYEPGSLIVLDDLMSEAAKSDGALSAFTRKSHQQNICLVILVQNFFHRNLRGISTCCHYICLMKNPRDSAHINLLGRQLNRGKKYPALEMAYDECMQKRYEHVFID